MFTKKNLIVVMSLVTLEMLLFAEQPPVEKVAQQIKNKEKKAPKKTASAPASKASKKQKAAAQVAQANTPEPVMSPQPDEIVTSQEEVAEVKAEPVVPAIPGLPADAYLLDQGKAVIFSSEDSKIIPESALRRQSLDGKVRSLDDLVLEVLILLDAQKFKMIPDEDVIDRHLATVQRENNLTLDDLKKIFSAAGYTFEEGREQFGMISIINQVLDFKIRSRLIVPEREVIAYYNANPEVQEATYHIKRAVVPLVEGIPLEEQKEQLANYLCNNIGYYEIAWQESFWLNQSELADNLKCLMELQAGQATPPKETTGGLEVFRLIEKKPEVVKTLEERYRSIVEILRRPKYEQLFNDYKKQLMDNAAVLILE